MKLPSYVHPSKGDPTLPDPACVTKALEEVAITPAPPANNAKPHLHTASQRHVGSLTLSANKKNQVSVYICVCMYIHMCVYTPFLAYIEEKPLVFLYHPSYSQYPTMPYTY